MEYSVNKLDFGKKYTKFMYVFFENGDYIYIDGRECITIAVTVYDKLVRRLNGFCAVAESGCIELKFDIRNAYADSSCFLHDPQECERDRKQYIERRFAESRIIAIRFFDKFNWSYELLGNFCVQADGELLRINVLSVSHMGDAIGRKHTIFLREPKKEDVVRMHLDFENCEGFDIFGTEIKELEIELEKKLALGSSLYQRRVKSGYMVLRLQKNCNERRCYLFGKDHVQSEDLARRLYGATGYTTHDICHLYVDFYHAGYGHSIDECIDLGDMKSAKEIDKLIKQEEIDESYYYAFQSGYAKRLKGGEILLTFGKTAKQAVKEFYQVRACSYCQTGGR